MIGQTISHYRVIQKLGEGGMGVVYKAEDTKLDRVVALKFLAPHLVKDEESHERFLREAKAAAALNHPNICTIYEVDETEGRVFIAMEWVDGISLGTKLESSGPLPIEEALDIAIQASKGIQEAHRMGVVHRDLKTANIMVGANGLTKVLDFGLAQVAGSRNLTKTGSVLGTAAYMSPEQILGEKVDHQCDIWSLGVVLYEMLAGRQPFSGEYEVAVTYSVVNQEPEPLTLVRSDVPIELERLVSQTLRKRCDERYQTVESLLDDLTSLQARPTETTEPLEVGAKEFLSSIAVLPFVDLSLGEDNDYFSEGLTEELVNTLAQVDGLKGRSALLHTPVQGKTRRRPGDRAKTPSRCHPRW